MTGVDSFDGFSKQLGSNLTGGKRKKGNGHKATCGCPICKNMKKGKRGGVILVGGVPPGDASAGESTNQTGETIAPIEDKTGDGEANPQSGQNTDQMGGSRRRRRSSSRKSRRKSRNGGRKKSKSRRR